MTHLKRILWLAAWSVWLWLGFGLYRELPRKFGKPICTLPISEQAMIAGFIGTTNHVVVVFREDRSGQTTVRAFDAQTGAVAAETKGPPQRAFLLARLDPVRHELLFANELEYPEEPIWKSGVFVLDTPTMKWRRVADHVPYAVPHASYAVSHHSKRPWLLFIQNELPQGRVVALDYTTGKEVFARNLDETVYPHPPPFFGAAGQVVVPIERPATASERSPTATVEVWTIAEPPTREAVISDIPFGPHYGSPVQGRLASMDPNSFEVRVFDSNQSRVVFSQTPLETFAILRRRTGWPRPALDGGSTFALSPSGRCVLGVMPTALWDVDSRRAVWLPGPHEQAFGLIGADDQFQVVEKWSELWNRWLPHGPDYVTYAFRSLETGELIYRTSDRVPLHPSNCNVERTLGVANDGNIYRLPLKVNWPLLALCQTILASPLALLWVALRWWKRKKACGGHELPDAVVKATP
jgi:hypothetical protein